MVLLCCFFPMWLKVKMSNERWTSCKNLLIIMVGIVLCTLGAMAAVVSVLDTMKVIDINSYACIPDPQ
jgi:hypothetical protein